MKFLFQLAAGFSAIVAVVSAINAGTAFIVEQDIVQPLSITAVAAVCGFLLLLSAEICKGDHHRIARR